MPEFTDEYHPRVKRDLRKIDKSVESEVKDIHIPRILHDPYIAGELTGDLAGIRVRAKISSHSWRSDLG